jgi:hypothetical protein
MRTRHTLAILVLALGGCAGPSAQETVTLQLRELNASGVTGSVTLMPATGDRTRVEVTVDSAGHPSMPAHIHPGTCDQLTPQPKYPLENVQDGQSTTDVPVPLAELLADEVALNLHASNEQMDVYTACIEL